MFLKTKPRLYKMFYILCAVLYLEVVKTNFLVQAYRKDESLYRSARAMSNPVKKLFNNINGSLIKLNSNNSVDNLLYSEVSEPPTYDYVDVWWTEHKTPRKQKITTVKITPTVTKEHINMSETLKPTIIKKKIKVLKKLRNGKRKKLSQKNGTHHAKKKKTTFTTTTETTTIETTTAITTSKEVERESEKLMYILNRDDTKGEFSINVNETDILVDARSNKDGIHASVVSGLLFKNDTALSDFDYIIYDRNKNHYNNTSSESDYGNYFKDLDKTDGTAPLIIKVMKPEETALGLEQFKNGAQMIIGPEKSNMPKVYREGIYRIEMSVKPEQKTEATSVDAAIPDRNGDGNEYPNVNDYEQYGNGPYNQQQINQIYNSNSTPKGMPYYANAPFGQKHYLSNDSPVNPNDYGNSFGPNFPPPNGYGGRQSPNFNPNAYGNPFGPNFPPPNGYGGRQGPNFNPNAYGNPFGPNFPPPNGNNGPQGPNYNPNAPFGTNFNPNANRGPRGPNSPPRGPHGPNSLPRGPHGRNAPRRGPHGPNSPPRGPHGPNYLPRGPHGVDSPPRGPHGVDSPPRGPQGRNPPPRRPNGPKSPLRGPHGVNFPPRGSQGRNAPPRGPHGPNSLPRGPPGPNFPLKAYRSPHGPNFILNDYVNPLESNFPPNGNRGPQGPYFNPNAFGNPFGSNVPSNANIGSQGSNFNQNAYGNPFGPNFPPNGNRDPQGPNFNPNAYGNPLESNFPPNGNRGPQGPNFNPNAYGNPLESNFPPNRNRGPQGPNFNPNAYGNPLGSNFPPNGNRGPQGPNFNPNAYGNPLGSNFALNGNSGPQGLNYIPNASIGSNLNPNGYRGPQGANSSLNNNRGPHDLNSSPNANIGPQDPNSPPNINNTNMIGNPFNHSDNPNSNGGIRFNENANKESKPQQDNPNVNKHQKPIEMPKLPDGNIGGNNTNMDNLSNQNESEHAIKLEEATNLMVNIQTPSKYAPPDPHIDPEAYLPTITEVEEWTPHSYPTTRLTQSTARSTIDMHYQDFTNIKETKFPTLTPHTRPSFGRPPIKLSPYVHELRKMMRDRKIGYFSTAIISLLNTLALKPKKEARVLFSAYENEVETLNEEMHLGRPLEDAMNNLAEYLSHARVDEIQARVKMLHEMFLIRHESLPLDINSVVDYIDKLYTEKEGIILFQVLEKIHDYPKGKPTARILHREFTEALYHPLIRLARTEEKEILINSLVTLVENYVYAPPIGRRHDNVEDNISDMNQFAYYTERFKFYKIKLSNLSKHTQQMEARNNRTISDYRTKLMDRNHKTTKIRRAIETKKNKRTTTAIRPTTSPTTPELTTSEVTTRLQIPKQQQRFKIKNSKLIKRINNATDRTTTTEMFEAYEEAESTTTTKMNKQKMKDSHHKQKKIFIKKKQLLRLKLKHPKLYKKYFKRKRKHKKHKKDRKIHKKTKKLRRSKHKLGKFNKILHKYLSIENEYEGLMKEYTGTNMYLNTRNDLQTPSGIISGLPDRNNMSLQNDNILRIRKKQIKNSKPHAIQNIPSGKVQKWLPIPMSLHNGNVLNFTLNPIFDKGPDIMDGADMVLSKKFENFLDVVPKSLQSTRKHLIPMSSYSDDEETLKIHIFDAMRHYTEHVNARRRDDVTHRAVDSKNHNLLSSYSNEEIVLKSKIYKGFAFHSDPAQNRSIEEVNSSSHEELKADITRILPRRQNAKPIQEVSSYSDEETVIKKNLKF